MKYKVKPWGFQQKIIDNVVSNRLTHRALFLDMGCGKTKITVEILRAKCIERGRQLKTLIICPLVVVNNWKRELLMHSYIKEEVIQLIDGCTRKGKKPLKNPSKKLRLEQLQNVAAKVFVLNTDNVSNVELWNEILNLGIEFLVVDESHKFKNHLGKRTKALHKLSTKCRYKYILTGSPILQSALDLHAQFYILDPKILGENFYSFRSQYFYDTNAHMPAHVHFPNFVPKDDTYFKKMGFNKKQSMQNLSKIIYRHADRVMKDDVLDLPDRVYQTLEVPMHKEQARIYKDMRDDLIAFIDNPKLESVFEGLRLEEFAQECDLPEMMRADLVIVKTLRLQQLICGIFTNTEGVVYEIPNNRIKVLKELLEELVANPLNKIIIWSVFVPTYKTIANVCEELGIKYVMITGQQSAQEKNDAEYAFQNDAAVQAMVSNPASGGVGLNLTAANYEIDFSRGFNLEHWLQKDARAHRGGQLRKTTSIALVTPDTIDSKIVVRLNEKIAHAEDILAVKNNELTRAELLSFI